MEAKICFNIRLNADDAKDFKHELNILDPTIGNVTDTMAAGYGIAMDWTFCAEHCRGLALQLQAMSTLMKVNAVVVDYTQLKEGEMLVYRVLKELHDMRLEQEARHEELYSTSQHTGV